MSDKYYLGNQREKRNATPITSKEKNVEDKTVRIDGELHKRLRIESAMTGTKAKNMVDQAVSEYLDRLENR